MKKIRAVVYTRVSTDKEEQKTSLKFQKEHYTQFCERNGYELIKIYADEGLTGTNSKREKFLEMLHSAGLNYATESGDNTVNFNKSFRDPHFDLIIVKDVTRFSRNMDTLRPIRLLKEKGVHILFENNNLNTESDDYAERLNFYLMFAENESRDKSKKMKWTMRHKAKQKQFHFSVLPYGFDYNEDSKTYTVNEEEAKVVRIIYDMYVNQNKGIRLIADYLNNNNIPNKKGKGKWIDTTIGRMIASERYIGNVVLQKYTKHDVTGTGQRITKDEDEWERIDGALEPIVEKGLWLTAQKLREERSQKLSDNSKKGRRLSEDIFHRKIKCGKCKSSFTRIASNKKRKSGIVREYFYMCYRRRKTKECDIRGLSYNVLEREINKIRTEILPERMTYQIKSERHSASELIKGLDERLENQKNELEKIQSELNHIDERVSKLADRLVMDNPNETVTNAIYNQIEVSEKEKEKLMLSKLDLDPLEIENEKMKIRNELKKIEKFYKKSTLTFEEVVNLIEEVVVKDSREFSVRIGIPSLQSYYLWASHNKKLNKEYKRHYFVEVKY